MDKKHHGRPKGATSYITLSLSDLMDKLSDDDKIVVSRRWWSQLTGTKVQPEGTATSLIKSVVVAQTEETEEKNQEESKVEMELTV